MGVVADVVAMGGMTLAVVEGVGAGAEGLDFKKVQALVVACLGTDDTTDIVF